MQYAPDETFGRPDDMRPRVRKRLLDGMEDPLMDPVSVGQPLVDANGMPRSGNTGVTGGAVPRPTRTPLAPSAPSEFEATVRGAVKAGRELLPAAPATKPPAARGGTMQDVLSSVWTPDVLGGIRSAQTEDAKKAAAEQAIRSILPQLQQMGIAVDDVRNEKIQIGGKWYDLLKDVSGRAIPQFLDVDAHAAKLAAANGGAQTGTLRGMDGMQTSLIDQIRASIMALMARGEGVG